MTVLDYMNSAAVAFWNYPAVSVLQGCVEWGFFLWYVAPLPARQRQGWQSWGIAALFFGACLLLQVQNAALIIHFPLYMLLWTGYIRLMTCCTLPQGIFCGSIFCLCMELCRLICRDGFLTILLSRKLVWLPDLACILIFVFLYLGCLCLGVGWFRKKTGRLEHLEVTAAQLLGLLFPLILYVMVRQYVFTYLREMSLAVWLRLELLQVAIAGCAEVVITTTGAMVSAQMERNALLQKEMLNEKRRQQYLAQKETIEIINRKYHDLKHCISAMEAMKNEEMEEYIQTMRREIQPYECVQRTGNEVLDILLAERIGECQRKGIRLVPYVDGRRLDFLGTMDLCVIFGNAMDNAIEATEKLTYVNMKEISIKIGVSDQLLIMRFQNYYEGEPRRRGEKLLTGKEDDQNHGYGLENIQAAAARYGGTVACETENQEFSLNILIPLPNG